MVMSTLCIILALCLMEGQKVAGKKVAIGKSNSIKQYNVESLHAEMDALMKLPRHYLSYDLDIIVVRFSSSGKLCSSRPCYHCLKTFISPQSHKYPFRKIVKLPK